MVLRVVCPNIRACDWFVSQRSALSDLAGFFCLRAWGCSGGFLFEVRGVLEASYLQDHGT